ncbi:unnamed protein product [Prorocentrum cordatum]|uniref:Uncharacterized protein n=1 Tax=Prorocentrum cordatum TaxID=2364126 RepID=A0ABN9Y3Z2_9DINO|nr:unnamed protein product [Polarella glacialis]
MSRGRGDLYKLALGPEAVRAALAWPGRHTHRPTGPEVGLRGGGCLKISPPDSYLPGLGENDKAAKTTKAQLHRRAETNPRSNFPRSRVGHAENLALHITPILVAATARTLERTSKKHMASSCY